MVLLYKYDIAKDIDVATDVYVDENKHNNIPHQYILAKGVGLGIPFKGGYLKMNKVGNASLYYLQLVNVLSPMKIYTSTIMYETCGKASMGKHSDNDCTKNKKFCMFTEVMYGSNGDLAPKTASINTSSL